MLELKKISKEYRTGAEVVHALRDVDLAFRESEFVSILGPSGCGKTTMLNILGGLDQYTSGDLIIDGISTKEYKDADWDAYRNDTIGFVFQSYNLISHQTVLANVELALTLSGVSAGERRQRAIAALEQVGLGDQINKKPAQMSGGQVQRVAIARALINDPDIILADEPTGALDSETSVQIMSILKDISREKLVIMVTHNPELAKEYSTRIVRLSDGQVISDSDPFVPGGGVEGLAAAGSVSAAAGAAAGTGKPAEDENGNKYYDEDVWNEHITEFVDELAVRVNTVWKDKEFESTDDGLITVQGGTYGYSVDKESETESINDVISSGGEEERSPRYYTAETGEPDVNDGIGSTYIEVSIDEQHLWYYEDGEMVMDSPVVTGNKGNHDTPKGVFTVMFTQHPAVLRGRIMPNGEPEYESPVSYWMPFYDGCGFHDATWRGSFGGSIYTYNGSHGCVNMPYSAAQELFEYVDGGTVVVIY